MGFDAELRRDHPSAGVSFDEHGEFACDLILIWKLLQLHGKCLTCVKAQCRFLAHSESGVNRAQQSLQFLDAYQTEPDNRCFE